MTVTQDLNQHPRVSALLDCFREADVVMRELPLYNAEVAIEAIDFRAFGEDALIGVVLTPWFMNLVLLPVAPEPMRMSEIGRPVEVALPVGKRTFVIGGNDVVGLYRANSLHSPVLTFTLPGQAQAEARRQLALLMTPPAQERAANQNGSAGIDRRRLLFGRGQILVQLELKRHVRRSARHNRREATPFFERLCPAMTNVLSIEQNSRRP